MASNLTPRDSLIQPGDAAPDFTLSTKEREDWTLSENLDKGDIVLCFVPFAFTGVCGTEMECLSKEMSRWTDAGATPVAVSCDSFASLQAWAERDGYTHTMLSDLHRTVCKAYGLFWEDMNVAQRGTVVISKDESGAPVVRWSQARQPGDAMDADEVIAAVS